MIRLYACLAVLAIGLMPLAAQEAGSTGTPSSPPALTAGTNDEGGQGGATAAPTQSESAAKPGQGAEAGSQSTSPYKQGDQAVSLAAGALIPLGIYGGGSATGTTYTGADFSFSYRYFLNHQWAVGGSLSGGFNSTTAGRSLFTAPLSAEISWWKAVVPFEFFVEAGLGGYMMRLDTNGIIDPFAKLGVGALWQTGSGWSVGLRVEGWYIPEIHYDPYSSLTRTGISLETGLIAVYHI